MSINITIMNCLDNNAIISYLEREYKYIYGSTFHHKLPWQGVPAFIFTVAALIGSMLNRPDHDVGYNDDDDDDEVDDNDNDDDYGNEDCTMTIPTTA